MPVSSLQFQPEKGEAFESSAIEAVINELYVGSPNCVFFGIFEGHGPKAKEVVYFVGERLPAEISTLASDGSKTFQECFDTAFANVEKELIASEIDVKSSGCTCCSIVMEVSWVFQEDRASTVFTNISPSPRVLTCALWGTLARQKPSCAWREKRRAR